MRVFQIEGDWGFDNLKLAERPAPTCGPSQVVVAVRMASLSSRDLIVPECEYGRATGEVIKIDAGVTRVAVGDRVCPTYFHSWTSGEPTPERFASALGGPLDGAMADQVCLSPEGVVKIPGYLTDAEADTLPCAALTAWSAIVTHGHIRASDKVSVQGTGSVALFALLFAKPQGAHVISSSDDRLARVTEMGANAMINYRTTEDWARASRPITADRGGYDNIIELGGAKTLPLSLRSVRPGGTLSMTGVLSGLNIEASLGPIVARQVRRKASPLATVTGSRLCCGLWRSTKCDLYWARHLPLNISKIPWIICVRVITLAKP